MLFHLSIAAHAPAHVASVIAELWRGEVFPFPPIAVGSFMALAPDDRGTAMEVYPIDTVLREAEGDADAYGEASGHAELTPTHAAIATALGLEEVLAIARREGWPAKYRKRGGLFGVVEMWVEGRQMIEVLTPEMQDEYRATMTPAGWRALLAAGAPA